MIKNSNKPVVGSVVTKADKKNLINCPLAKPIGFRFGVPIYICDLGFGGCSHSGHRAKFRAGLEGFYVISICERLDSFPVLEK